MGMFLQKVDHIKTKSGSSFKNVAAEVTKLGAGDEIRRFDGTGTGTGSGNEKARIWKHIDLKFWTVLWIRILKDPNFFAGSGSE